MHYELAAAPPAATFQRRIDIMQRSMAADKVDLLILTSRANFEYFSGLLSQFWVSPARPLLAVIDRRQPGIRLVMSRGESRNPSAAAIPGLNFSFYDGFLDGALDALVAGIPTDTKLVAIDYGDDHFGRGSLAMLARLRERSADMQIVERADLIWAQRMVKDETEISEKRVACSIATGAFFECLANLEPGQSEHAFGQALKQSMIGRGAHAIDWLPVRFGAGALSYTQPPTERQLQANDFIWVDMGARYGTQISDLNRVAKAGKATPTDQDLYGFVRDTTLRLAETVRPGMSGADVFATFEELWSKRDLPRFSAASRIGHGSGVELTEPPSLMAGSDEIIKADMILHLEPKVETDFGVYQVEEVFRVTSAGPEFLSEIAPATLPTLMRS